jgi:hypothetical protein
LSIRERLNENPVPTAVGVGVIILISLALGLRSGCSATGGRGNAAGITREFFTVDDGRTWFAEDARKVPPFDYQGKTAYRVRVYQCAGGKPFVSHLERYPEAERARVEELIAGPATLSKQSVELLNAFEVKRPGGKEWVKSSSPRARTISTPRCPDGSARGVQRVTPE